MHSVIRKIVFPAAFILLSLQLKAQIPNLTKVIPPAPNVAALQKYADIPVSLYTGVPDISIPLYTVKSHDISFPITVSYHASGIKVAEEASQVGLGWALNAGGQISRNIVGTDDFSSNAYFGNGYPEMDANYTPNGLIQNSGTYNAGHTNSIAVADALSGNIDFQPDEYYFSIPGASGKFLMKRDYTPVLQSLQKLDITCLPNPNATSNMAKDGSLWQIKTVDGYIYDFSQVETYTHVDLIPHISAVYLTRITSPTGNTITFHYKTNGLSANLANMVGSYVETKDDLGPVTNGYQMHIIDALPTQILGGLYSYISLDYIDYDNGRVVFNYSAARLDLPYDNELDGIQVFAKDVNGILNTTPLKTFSFLYDYFSGVSGPNGTAFAGLATGLNAEQNIYSKRLKLLSITEKGNYKGKTIVNSPYLFTYNEGYGYSLPIKSAFSVDHWGYFNGQTNNKSFIPSYNMQLPVSDIFKRYYGIMGPERDANPYFVSAFALTQIQYPTGGKTMFDYEANDCDEQKSMVRDSSGYPYRYSILRLNNEFQYSYDVNTATAIYGNTLDLSNEFADPSQGAIPDSVRVTFVLNGQYNNLILDNHNYVSVLDSAGNEVVTAMPSSSIPISTGAVFKTVSFVLRPGKYHVIPHLDVSAGSWGSHIRTISINFSWYTQVTSNPAPGATNAVTFTPAGGMRIRTITEADGFGPPKIRRFNYHYQLGNHEFSYGRRMAKPQYTYWEQSEDVYDIITNSGKLRWIFNPEHTMRISESSIPLNGAGNGTLVGYDQVIVLYGSNGQYGKSVYEYHNVPDSIPPYIYQNLPRRHPFNSNISDPLNGSLVRKVDYKYEAGQYLPVKEVRNTYVGNMNYASYFYGIQDHINPHFSTTISGGGALPSTFTSAGVPVYYDSTLPVEYGQSGATYEASNKDDRLLFAYSPIQSIWTYLSSTTEKNYSLTDTSKNRTTLTKYYYDNPQHYLPTRVSYADSKGDTVTTTTAYPMDFTYLDQTKDVYKGINNLLTQHILNAPVEKYVQKEGSGHINKRTVFGSIIKYNPVFPAMAKNIYTLQSNVTVGNYLPFSNASSTYIDTILYKPVVLIDKVDSLNGNILQQHKYLDIADAYQWGYHKEYPVAECKNAAWNEFYYEGFEENPAGTAGFGHTGNKGLSDPTGAGYTVTWAIPNTNKAYKIAYWYLVSGVWTYSGEKDYTSGSYLLTGGSAYDDIRIYPNDAQLTTYTYEPLIGVTSMMAPSGQTVYYEYDAMQRLVNVRDKDGNIVKNYKYHYQNQSQ